MESCGITRAAPGDEPALRALWQAVFGDGDALLDAFFRLLYAPELCRVARAGGAPVSAGYCLPGPVAGAYRCAYIYAMATLPAHRGRGLAAAVARALAADAFAAGADVVATLPASESLCAWYAATLGMAPAFRRGGAGVVFPASWHAFAAACGPPEGGAPPRLYAVCRPGLDPAALRGLGWALTFD